MKPKPTTAPVSITLRVITVGRGHYKPGLMGYVAGAPTTRRVYIGKDCEPFDVAEWPIILDGSRLVRPDCQLGREFVFV
jgi:hypothetical protein